MTTILSGPPWKQPLRLLLCSAPAIFAAALPTLAADPAPAKPLDCVLEPYEVVEVSSAVQGVINKIYVDRNDMVTKGQLLVELDSEVERTQVNLARARARLQTNIELRETELAFNVRNEQRLEKLYKTDTISLHIKDQAETDTRKSRLQLRNAKDNRRLAELELAKAEAILALRSMHSPISGVVVARNRVAGEFVEDQSILRLAQLDPLKVEVIAPVELFGSISAGMQVEVMPEHSGQAALVATVTMVDRMIDPASGTFDIRAELPNPDLAIPSGLRCTVVFLDEPVPDTGIMAATGYSNGPATITSQPASEPAAHCKVSPPIERTLYTVLADPANNTLPIRELVDKLHEEGVHELFVVTQGVNRGQVSLGVYAKIDNAEQRQAEVSSLGFTVSLASRPSVKPQPGCEADGQIADSVH